MCCSWIHRHASAHHEHFVWLGSTVLYLWQECFFSYKVQKQEYETKSHEMKTISIHQNNFLFSFSFRFPCSTKILQLYSLFSQDERSSVMWMDFYVKHCNYRTNMINWDDPEGHKFTVWNVFSRLVWCWSSFCLNFRLHSLRLWMTPIDKCVSRLLLLWVIWLWSTLELILFSQSCTLEFALLMIQQLGNIAMAKRKGEWIFWYISVVRWAYQYKKFCQNLESLFHRDCGLVHDFPVESPPHS